MRRIFGAKKKGQEKPPAASLDEISKKMEDKSSGIDKKIADLDRQLVDLKKKMKSSRGAAKARYKQQALQVLKRRKMYDNQRNQYQQQRSTSIR